MIKSYEIVLTFIPEGEQFSLFSTPSYFCLAKNDYDAIRKILKLIQNTHSEASNVRDISIRKVVHSDGTIDIR